MCPGVDSASKYEYQVNPGGKGGRCVKSDNLPPSCADVKKSGGLNLLEPGGPVMGQLYLYLIIYTFTVPVTLEVVCVEKRHLLNWSFLLFRTQLEPLF
jgi:hypothetical protein